MHRPINPKHIEVVDDAIAEILRRNGGVRSVHMVASGWKMMRSMVRTQLNRAHPDWDESQVEHAVSRRMADGAT